MLLEGSLLTLLQYPLKFLCQTSTNPFKLVDEQIACFLERGIIEKATHPNRKYISHVFIRPKKDGSYRLILNLQQLNESVEYYNFKIKNLMNVIILMTPTCFMASIDLKDVYYSVSVNTQEILEIHLETSTFFLIYLPNEWFKLCTKNINKNPKTNLCNTAFPRI